jgi:phosphoribosylanthranilate isomerase
MRTKICGIRDQHDVDVALSAGADALGFLIGLGYRTNDEVDPDFAKRIIRGLPPFVSSVFVTHDLDVSHVLATCKMIAANTIQMHGAMALPDLERLRRELPRSIKLIQAVHVDGPDAVKRAKAVARVADALLLDTKTKDRIGGTGLTHDWAISAHIVEEVPRPVILAGGLTPDNVAAAIVRVRPFAVDVNSGVEAEDGSKHADKVRDFVRRAREAFSDGQPASRPLGRLASGG